MGDRGGFCGHGSNSTLGHVAEGVLVWCRWPDGDGAKVFVFDIASLKITGEIKSEPDTDSIFYDPASKRVFTFNGDSKNSTVIDPAKGTVIAKIPDDKILMPGCIDSTTNFVEHPRLIAQRIAHYADIVVMPMCRRSPLVAGVPWLLVSA